MDLGSSHLVDVFPISTSAFGLRSDWFQVFTPKFVRPAYLLMALLLVISIGVMTLKRFEEADFEKKVWNLPVLLTVVLFWPSLMLGMKDLVDSFNTFLVVNIFAIPWQGFGFPELKSLTNIVGWPAEGLARLLPNLGYWIIYAFYTIFFFFYAVLGPLILAKGVLFDEMEAFLGLVKEFLILLLWQTTLVILVAFIMPDIVSGKSFPAHPEANFYFLSFILGVMIFFVPSLTRKFAVHLESAFMPLGFRWGGAMLGLAAAGKVGAGALAGLGASARSVDQIKWWKDRALKVEDFRTRYDFRTQIHDLKEQRNQLEQKLREDEEEEHASRDAVAEIQEGRDIGLGGFERGSPSRTKDRFLEFSKKAQEEMRP